MGMGHEYMAGFENIAGRMGMQIAQIENYRASCKGKGDKKTRVTQWAI